MDQKGPRGPREGQGDRESLGGGGAERAREDQGGPGGPGRAREDWGGAREDRGGPGRASHSQCSPGALWIVPQRMRSGFLYKCAHFLPPVIWMAGQCL